MTVRQGYQSLRWTVEFLSVYVPAAKACKAYKFARPFPHRIVEWSETGMSVHPVVKIDHRRTYSSGLQQDSMLCWLNS